MDRAVLAAYGWSDLPTACEFIPDCFEEEASGEPVPKSIRYRWPDAIRNEILFRLPKLNAERAKQERAIGTARGQEKTGSRKRPEFSNKQPANPAQQTVFLNRTDGRVRLKL